MRQTLEELDKKIPAIRGGIAPQHLGLLYTHLNQLLEVGYIEPLNKTVGKEYNKQKLVIDLCLNFKLIYENQWNMNGQTVYRITDLGYLYCMRTPDIWDRKRVVHLNKHSLVVLNPNDYDQNEKVYSIVGSQNCEILLLDWSYEKFDAAGNRIYHHTATIDELIHATSDEILSNQRKEW